MFSRLMNAETIGTFQNGEITWDAYYKLGDVSAIIAATKYLCIGLQLNIIDVCV